MHDDTVVNNTDPNLKNTDTFNDGETSIAINPNNHNEIVISAFSGIWGTYPSYAPLWLSLDGGRTWAKEFTVGQPYGVDRATECPCDQTFDYGNLFTGGNLLYTVLFGSILAGTTGNNIYTGDIFDPSLVETGPMYSPSSGSPTEQTNRLANPMPRPISPGCCYSPGTLRPIRTFRKSTSPTPISAQARQACRLPVRSTAAPRHIFQIHTTRGPAPPSTRPTIRATVLLSIRATAGCTASGKTASTIARLSRPIPKTIEFMLNRSTDGNGLIWGLNGQSGGIPIVISYSTQPNPKFGTVNALFGGVLTGAVDPSTGDFYYVTGYGEDDTGTYNELAMVRIYDCGGGDVCSAPLTRVVSGAVEAALPAVAVTRHGTIGVLYYTYNGMVSGFPQFSTWLATSTDKGATFTAQLLATFLSPATDNGDARQRVFGDYVQMKAVDNCFYGSYTGNGAAFGRSVANNDPIFFKACVPGTASTHDYDGDGKSDILWRDTSGHLALWLMYGGTVSSNSLLATVPTSWTVVGQNDFDGDGRYDILWRDNTGNVAIWLMNGATITSNNFITNVSNNWTIVGVGDYNGDGKADILWRDTNGNLAIWFMNGATVTSNVFIANVPTNWSVIGSSGKGILWRDTTGNVALWKMDGPTVVSNTFLGNVALSWSVVGGGDFDGDGNRDFLWHDTNGNVAIWFMDGTGHVASNVFVSNVPTTWSIVETGDFNTDGKADILWHDTSGNTAIWLMNGGTVSSNLYVANVPAAWSVQGNHAD